MLRVWRDRKRVIQIRARTGSKAGDKKHRGAGPGRDRDRMVQV